MPGRLGSIWQEHPIHWHNAIPNQFHALTGPFDVPERLTH